MDYFVKKKNNTLEDWNPEKIATAVQMSAERIGIVLSEQEIISVINYVQKRVFTRSDNVVPVQMLHSLVEQALLEAAKGC